MKLHDKGNVMSKREGERLQTAKVNKLTRDILNNLLGVDAPGGGHRVYVGIAPNTCEVHRESPVSGEWNIMILGIPAMRVEKYYLGLEDGLIQDIFPELSASEREFILTGMTSEDWDETFADEYAGKEEDESKCQHCGGPNH